MVDIILKTFPSFLEGGVGEGADFVIKAASVSYLIENSVEFLGGKISSGGWESCPVSPAVPSFQPFIYPHI
jgi:hypothetical protein